MRPITLEVDSAAPDPRPRLLAMRVATAVLSAAAILGVGYLVLQGTLGAASDSDAAEPGGAAPPPVESTTTSSTTSTSTTSTTSTTTTSMPPAPPSPPHGARYVVPSTEIVPEAKQLAVDVAYALTTYDLSDDHWGRLRDIPSVYGVSHLFRASEPLRYDGKWSRGEVVYPQMGGLTDERASMMVVTRQTVGSGMEAEFTVVRTLDIRLVLGDSGWEFEFLDSAGGVFESLEDLETAHAVAADQRIEMPDSARLDILDGIVSPILLRLMAEIADRTDYAVSVLATGHPHHVFETDRLSHHTVGRAVDIYRVGDRLVVDDRGPNSATRALVEWLLDHPDVYQVGSPWRIDREWEVEGGSPRRSFTNLVHQDHLHIAVMRP